MENPGNYLDPFNQFSRVTRIRLEADEEIREKLLADSDGTVVYVRQKMKSVEYERSETEE